MDNELLTVAEAAEFLRIGLTFAYESVRTGRIPSIKLGRKYLIPKGALAAMVEREAASTYETSRERG